MLTKAQISNISCLSFRLGRLESQCDTVASTDDVSNIPVREKGGFVDELKDVLDTLDDIFEDEKGIIDVKKEIKRWINHFTKKYAVKDKIFKRKSFHLEENDAAELSEEIHYWILTIQEHIENRGPSLLKDEKFEMFFPLTITKKLDKKIKNDLKDGYDILLQGFPTPASMILFRAAEAITKKYYEKTIGVKINQLGWMAMITELRNKSNIKKPLLNYLDYLRDKRNESAHPGKSFTQTEGEQILFHVKDLLEGIRL